MPKPIEVWKPFPGAQQRFLSCPAWEVLLHGNRGGGKSQPLWSQVLTEKGFVFMGDLSVGSEVICPIEGEPKKIVGIFPQGHVDVYKIITEYGYTYCSLDHLWMIKFASNGQFLLRRTYELINLLDKEVPVYIPKYNNPLNVELSQILRIEKYPKQDFCQCIKVDSIDGLYITDNYLVTHNTDVLLMDYLQGVGQGFGIDYKGLLLREATTELGDVITKSKKWIPRIFPTAKFNNQKKTWAFEGGETLWLNYARVEDDYWQYHGHEIPWIGWEEVTNHALPNVYLKLMSCNRSSNSKIPLKYRSTCNPSGPGHCVPYGDVLTPTGWVDIKNIKVNDLIFSVDSEGFLFETNVNQIHKEYYEGKLIDVNKKGFSLTCTPNHKLPKLGGIVGNREQKYTLIPFKELPGQASILRSCEFEGVNPSDEFFVSEYNLTQIRKSRVIQPKKCRWKDLASLLGWFLSEGGTQPLNYSFSISKSIKTYPEKYIEIKNLLDRIGFKYTSNAKGFIIYSRDWFQFFHQFGSYEDKFIPKEYKNWNKDLLKLLFTSLVDGDGTWYIEGKSGEYYTTSKQLASDICEIALKLGYIIGTRFVHKENKRPCYVIRFKSNFLKHSIINTGNHRYSVNSKTKNIDVIEKDYSGFVYCLGVNKTHTFILRQKGSVWISGNSWVKERFIDKGPPEKIYYDEFGQARTHIQSSLLENRALLDADPNYQAKLLAMTQDNKMLRDAWVFGSWDLITGGFFTDVWDKKKHVLTPFKIPKSWRLLRSFDWGSSKPWCVTYGVEANGEQPDPVSGIKIPFIPRGSVIIIDEIYGWNGSADEGDRATSQEIAERILDKDRALQIEYKVKTIPGPADTSIWEVRDGTSIAANMNSHNCRWTKAYKGSGSRISGWAMIRQMLGAAKRQELESPHLYFFENAVHHIRTLPVMQRDKNKPEDIDTTMEDHAMDSLRYFLTRKLSTLKRRKVGI